MFLYPVYSSDGVTLIDVRVMMVAMETQFIERYRGSPKYIPGKGRNVRLFLLELLYTDTVASALLGCHRNSLPNVWLFV